MTRVGITTIQPRTSPIYAAFDERLRELGYIEGQNLVVDLLNPQKQAGGIAGAVAELLRRKVDIIVAPYESTVKSAIAATATVPIVMIAVDYDPLALGYIKSLSRPGGNVTGLFLQQPELAKKRLQLLTEALPGIQMPIKVPLIINVRTANALGLDVPLGLLNAAEEIIE
jgi:putative ABC transport system substrate-binding protein